MRSLRLLLACFNPENNFLAKSANGFIFCILVFCSTSFGFDFTHSLWTDVLATYRTSQGYVRYHQLKADLGDIERNVTHPLMRYLSGLAEVRPEQFDQWQRKHQMAFLINAYNAFTVKLVVTRYPVKTIRHIGTIFKSVWKKEFFSLLDGKIQSLHAIEHEYLRPIYKDPRIHAAINCASASCPKLQPLAFQGDKLEGQLESAFKEFLSDEKLNRYESAKETVYLSEIFEWFANDFTPRYGGYLNAISALGPPAAKQTIEKSNNLKVEFIDYDWSLNDASH